MPVKHPTDVLRIRYATADSPLGRLLVAGTDKGVRVVCLRDTDEELLEELRAEFPSAELTEDAEGLREWTDALVRHLSGEQPSLDLPLDVCATDFQKRVWDALRGIPYGETRTYSQVAAELGQPTAARAVARACATNPAALVIPCHRVIGTDGGLRGYRWVIERKKALLERERRASVAATNQEAIQDTITPSRFS